MRDYSELELIAKAATGFSDVSLAPDVVLGLIEEYKRVCELNHQQFGDAIRRNAERDQLKAENERLAAACERAEQIIIVECKAASLAKVRANLLEANRDQLRAEVAGLKTGYEAYEQVNAELKAEVEALRRVTGNRYAPPRAHLTGPSKCLSCGEIHYGMGGLPCPNMRITAQADLPETLSGQIGAALGQGELS